MANQDAAGLTERLESHAPGTLLAIGPGADELLAAYRDAHPDCVVTVVDPDGALDGAALLRDIEGLGRFDLVVLRGVLERLDEASGAHLMARLRDVHTHLLCVVLDDMGQDARWTRDALVAMGLAHWSTERVQAADVDVFGFDLGTYKKTPDWLNARHWAHPEHWDKYRW